MKSLAMLCLVSLSIARAAGIELALSPPRSPARVVFTGATGAGLVYSTVYDTADWSGSLEARRIDPGTGRLMAEPAWRSAPLLDAPGFDPAARVVLTHDGTAGAPFRWERQNPAQQTLLAGTDGEATGRRRVDFMRGDHRWETANGGVLRNRLRADGSPFRQADIVDSRPWFTAAPATRFAYAGFDAFRTDRSIASRPAMVYVGGNDGLLHGFDALDGRERLAYLPRGVVPFLRAHTQAGSAHRYLVDGSPFTGEADIRTDPRKPATWATVLVGSPGAGARGYFVLDVSRPAQFSESLAQATVLVDATGDDPPDPDIGYIVSEPAPALPGAAASQVVRLNDDRWAAVMGNGVGSRGQMPVLLLQYLDKTREMHRIAPACASAPAPCPWRGDNGLAAPALIDTDGDGRADVAYAGDLLGHVWKFDIADRNPQRWKVAFGGAPLFTARDADGHAQAIVAAPTWLPHPQGGVMLGIGTGRLLTEADRADRQTHTLYGLHDDGTGPVNRPDEPKRPLTLVRPGDTSPARGWYFDLPSPGERMLQPPLYLAGRKVVFRTTGQAQDYLTVLDLVTGRAPAAPVLVRPVTPTDATGDGSRIALPKGGFAMVAGTDSAALLSASSPDTIRLNKGVGRGRRVGWRRLQ